MKKKTIKIGHIKYKIIPVRDDHSNLLGREDSKHYEIFINRDLKAKENTLLHEVVHAIVNMNSLELTEAQINVIANNLHPLVKKSFKKYLSD